MIRPRRSAFPSLVAAIALAASAPLASLVAQQSDPSPGLDLAGMDRTVKPGENFFYYANGTWLKRTAIPPDRGSYGASAILAELTDRRVADLIQEAAKADVPAGSELRKIGDYYTSFMDTVGIEAAGLKPLQPALDSIGTNGVGNGQQIATWIMSFVSFHGAIMKQGVGHGLSDGKRISKYFGR